MAGKEKENMKRKGKQRLVGVMEKKYAHVNMNMNMTCTCTCVHAEYRKLEYRTYFSCGRGAATRHPHTTFSARRKRCGVEALSMSLSRPACSVRIAVKEPQGKRQDVGSSLHEPRSCRSARLHTKPGREWPASRECGTTPSAWHEGGVRAGGVGT
jgi:hypothetical protein